MSSIKRMVRYLERLNDWLVIMGEVFVVILTVLIVYGVIMRYIVGSSAVWVTELGLYMLVYVIFLPVPYLQQVRGHIRVDVLTNRLSKLNQTRVNIFSSAISLFAFIIFTWSMTVYAERAWVMHWHGGQPEGLHWPSFVIIVIIPICGFLLSLQILIALIKDIAALLTRKQVSSSSQGPAAG